MQETDGMQKSYPVYVMGIYGCEKFCRLFLKTLARYVILELEKGKAIEAALPSIITL